MTRQLQLANNATSKLASGIGSSDTTLTVLPGDGAKFPALSGAKYFMATLVKVDGTMEVVKVTARAGDTFTITRAAEKVGATQTAYSFTAGDKVELRLSAQALANELDHLASASTHAVQNKSADYTVTAGDASNLIRVSSSSGDVTVTLPLLSSLTDDYEVIIAKVSGDTHKVKIQCSGSNTINGGAVYELAEQFSSAWLIADRAGGVWTAVMSNGSQTASIMMTDPFTGDGTTTAFTLSGDPGGKSNTIVIVGGVPQLRASYTVSGKTLTLGAAPGDGVAIEVWWWLAADFAALKASSVRFDAPGTGGVSANLQVRGEQFVFAEDYDTLSNAIVAGAGKTLILNGQYSINNAANDGLVVAVDNIRITGHGVLNFSSIAHNGIKITGKNVVLDGITVKGPGTYDTSGAGGSVIPGLIYIDGTGLTEPINCRIVNCKVLEPGTMGIVAYKAVGVEILNNRVVNSLPVSTWMNTSNCHLIRIYSCACYKVTGNYLRGFAEGIVIQAYPADTYTFDDFAGTAGSNKSRKGIVSNNTVVETYDHCIYFSNDNEHYVCNDNFLWMAADYEGGEGTCSLKLEGGYFEACGNYIREGIHLRNPYYGRVDNNNILIYSGRGTATNPAKFGILSQDVRFQRDLIGMSICGNTISAVGDIGIDAGIRMEGAVWSGYQSRVIDLSICNNNISGVGKNISGNGVGIAVYQDMLRNGSGNVSGSVGFNVNISGNVIDMNPYTGGSGSYGIEVLNIDTATITGNMIRMFSQYGISALGMSHAMVSGNSFVGNGASGFQKIGVFEGSDDTTLHVASVSNKYGQNQCLNCSINYFPAHQDTTVYDKVPLLYIGAASTSQSIACYDFVDVLLWSPLVSGMSLTLATTRPWGVGQSIKVVNIGSQSITVTNTGTTIAANTSSTLLCTGSNSFIAY